MLDAWAELLTLSTMIPLVPASLVPPGVVGPSGVRTEFVMAAGGQEPPNVRELMHPPPEAHWVELFPTLKKIRSVPPL